MLDDGTKRCFKCKKHLPLDRFYAGGRECKRCKRAYSQKHDEQSRRLARHYRERNREILKDKSSVARLNNPERYRATTALNNAVKYGKIEKPTKCSRCGYHGRIIGHQLDYNRPLHVMWVCSQCHYAIHNPECETNIIPA